MKVVKVEGNALKQYYPSRDDNFVIDADHAGQKDIYFRPQGNTEWTDFYGFLWIEASQGTGLDNNADDVKAVKIMRDGQFYILKGGKIFSITGQLVK